MHPHPELSRRNLLRLLLGAGVVRFLVPRSQAATALSVERLIADHAELGAPIGGGAERNRAEHRRYRAHAYIHLMGIPVFSRQDVGGGYAVFEEAAGEGQALIGLQFAGGSTPDRTRGLNRLGFIQEAVLETSGTPREAAYYGFMISSAEKNLDQAKKSLNTQADGTIPYSAASGAGRGGKFECTLNHLPLPARYNWSTFAQLAQEVQKRLPAASDTQRFNVNLNNAAGTPDTFLYSMRRAILDSSAKSSRAIVYNGKQYQLTTEKQPDPRAGQQLAARHATTKPASMWRLNGAITEAGTRSTSSFQVWYEQGDAAGLPVRIEFHPKSFLKLVFENSADEGPEIAYALRRNRDSLALHASKL